MIDLEKHLAEYKKAESSMLRDIHNKYPYKRWFILFGITRHRWVNEIEIIFRLGVLFEAKEMSKDIKRYNYEKD